MPTPALAFLTTGPTPTLSSWTRFPLDPDLVEYGTNLYTSDEDPTANMYPLFEGNACLPQDAGKKGATCQLGGLPVYSVNATSASQVQLAVNFARTLNLRLVIRNTGHDFLGKSTGAGALNIWTHNLKKMQFIKNYKSAGSYKGPAFKIGAGIQVVELYEAANKHGYTAVGGECRVSRRCNVSYYVLC